MKFLVLQMMKTNRLQRPQSIDNVLIDLHQIQTNRQQEPSGVTAKILDDENTIIANHQDETDSKKDIEVQEGKIKKGKKKLVIYVSSTILLFLLITIIGYNEFQDYCLSKIRISEVVTNNTQSIVDEYGKHPAWIELVNTNSTPINIGGLYITRDRSCLDRSMNSKERIKHMSMILLYCYVAVDEFLIHHFKFLFIHTNTVPFIDHNFLRSHCICSYCDKNSRQYTRFRSTCIW
jgi:hypothetical protein